ncbi:uncharacterized protein LOC125531610 [Triticum urartu]|uniref:uncharacterized protein LOC125531610 n=1 Tax=Triticum urartu TaxID=4572 RepID=UPI0020441A68|nr:uncharacterized protein LOC125531610 [Triticum urartu]
MEVRRGPAAAMDGRRHPKPYLGRRLNLQGRAPATADLRMTAPDLDAQPAAAATVGRPNARALLPSLMALLPPTLPPHVGMRRTYDCYLHKRMALRAGPTSSCCGVPRADLSQRGMHETRSPKIKLKQIDANSDGGE